MPTPSSRSARRWVSASPSPSARARPPDASIEAIADDAWTPIPYWLAGGADVAETTYTPFADQRDAVPVRLIVRRVRPTPGSQLALLTLYDFHAFVTDRTAEPRARGRPVRRPSTNAIRTRRLLAVRSSPIARWTGSSVWAVTTWRLGFPPASAAPALGLTLHLARRAPGPARDARRRPRSSPAPPLPSAGGPSDVVLVTGLGAATEIPAKLASGATVARHGLRGLFGGECRRLRRLPRLVRRPR